MGMPNANNALLLLLATSLSVQQLVFGQSFCPPLYRRYSEKHTFCLPPNAQCLILQRGVFLDDAGKIVQIHNEKRNKLAMGKESVGNLPPASDMMELEWDAELAEVAQKHAEQCHFAHDCNECRQIKNFQVGQNLYESWSIGSGMPKPDWKSAINSWYDEVENFNKGIIGSYSPVAVTGVIGHFTQLIWSKSWKIGCGYVVYKNGEEYRQLYTCNYGPTGNGLERPVYSPGKPCSRCPINSCCGKNCNGLSNFDGLCRIFDSNAPKNARVESYDYYCDFQQPQVCNFITPFGNKQWEISHTLSGSHVGIVLQGGESSSINFTTPFRGSNPSCLSLKYRKGPNVAGQPGTGIAQERFQIAGPQGVTFQIPLSVNTGDFMTFGMNLGYDTVFTFSITFSVPSGSPAQFLEVTDISFRKGGCS